MPTYASMSLEMTLKGSIEYNKLHKIRWMMNEVHDRTKDNWNMGERVVVDDMMINYEGFIV